MGRSDYISDSLVNIRDRLKTYSTGENSLPGTPQSAAASQDPVRQALKGRAAEAVNTKYDLEKRFQSALNELNGEITALSQRAEVMQARLAELQSLPDAPAGHDHASVGDYFRKIENIRLDYLREENARVPEQAQTLAAGSSVVDFLSISRRQWIKIGLGLTLPLIIAFSASALVIALAILIGMGVL